MKMGTDSAHSLQVPTASAHSSTDLDWAKLAGGGDAGLKFAISRTLGRFDLFRIPHWHKKNASPKEHTVNTLVSGR